MQTTLFLRFLEKSSQKSLLILFNKVKSKFEKFLSLLKEMINSNQKIIQSEWETLVKDDEIWKAWKEKKCQGPIHNYISKKIPSHQLNSNKEYNRKSKLKKMGNWVSLNQNYQLINSMETKFVNSDCSTIKNNLEKLLTEICQGNSLQKIKNHLGNGQNQKNNENGVKNGNEKEISEREEGELIIDEKESSALELHSEWRLKNLLLKKGLRLFVCDSQTKFLEFYQNFWNKQNEPELWEKMVTHLQSICNRENQFFKDFFIHIPNKVSKSNSFIS